MGEAKELQRLEARDAAAAKRAAEPRPKPASARPPRPEPPFRRPGLNARIASTLFFGFLLDDEEVASLAHTPSAHCVVGAYGRGWMERYFVAIDASIVDAPAGEVGMVPMVETSEWPERLAEWCSSAGIPHREPRWHACAYQGD